MSKNYKHKREYYRHDSFLDKVSPNFALGIVFAVIAGVCYGLYKLYQVIFSPVG